MIKKVLVIILAIVILSGCNINKNNYVIKINGNEISKEEYMIYLYEQKKNFEEKGGEDIWEMTFDGDAAIEVAKQNAISSIIMVKEAVKQSASLEIDKNIDEEKINKESDALYNEMGDYAKNNNITLEEVKNTISESNIQQKVYEFITDGFEISDADYQVFFDDYCEENKRELKNIKIRCIYIKSKKTDEPKEIKNAENVYEKVILGEDFKKLQEEYSNGTKSEIQLEEGILDSAVEEEAYNLKQGEVSDIIITADGFYILKAVEVKTVNMTELSEELKEKYITDKKNEIYKKQNDIWTAEYGIEKNEQEWNKITIDVFKSK